MSFLCVISFISSSFILPSFGHFQCFILIHLLWFLSLSLCIFFCGCSKDYNVHIQLCAIYLESILYHFKRNAKILPPYRSPFTLQLSYILHVHLLKIPSHIAIILLLAAKHILKNLREQSIIFTQILTIYVAVSSFQDSKFLSVIIS